MLPTMTWLPASPIELMHVTSARFNLAYWMELPYVVGVLKIRAHDSTLVTIVAQCTPGWKNRET